MSGTVFEEIPGIIPEVHPGFLEANWPWIALALLAAALLAGIAAAKFGAKKKPTPYELAMMRLKIADGETDPKRFASAASGAVRGYVSDAFGIPAPERTTEEFLAMTAADGSIPAPAREKISRMLALADMAKFAGAQFEGGGRGEMLSLARSFIEEDEAARKQAKK